MDRAETNARFHVEPLARAFAEEAGNMLGRAFSENPTSRATLAHCTPASRLARSSRMNRVLVRLTESAGVAEMAHDEGRVIGASLYFAPGQWPLPARALAWMGLSGLAVGLRGAARYAIYEKHIAPHHPEEPHFYLFVLGVDPLSQGRGVGAALLRSLCARADAAGRPCYLETDRSSSVRFYQRFGFEEVRELVIAPLDGLRVWLMQRKAAP